MRLWGRVLTAGAELPPSRLEIRNGRITSIIPAAAPDQEDLIVADGWIAPGLIDVQVNGAGGVDLTAASDPAWALSEVARTLAGHGITAFCPTIVSSPLETILARVAAYAPTASGVGAESLGAHVEGPFIDPEHRGVHDPAYLRRASRGEVEAWLAHGGPAIVTLAPEQPGGIEAVRQLVDAGVVVSMGHSGATVAEARAGLEAGARMATHLFNAMPPLHHRAPGLVGAVLASDSMVGIIADGVHIDPVIIDLVVRRCGVDRVVLVSDALAAAGSPPGESLLGDQTVVSDGRLVRRADGTLAGSAVLLDACLRNVRAWMPDVAPAKLVSMATQTPARLLGASTKGRVAVGADADLVVLDHDFSVVRTFVRGTPV